MGLVFGDFLCCVEMISNAGGLVNLVGAIREQVAIRPAIAMAQLVGHVLVVIHVDLADTPHAAGLHRAIVGLDGVALNRMDVATDDVAIDGGVAGHGVAAREVPVDPLEVAYAQDAEPGVVGEHLGLGSLDHALKPLHAIRGVIPHHSYRRGLEAIDAFIVVSAQEMVLPPAIKELP